MCVCVFVSMYAFLSFKVMLNDCDFIKPLTFYQLCYVTGITNVFLKCVIM